MKNPATEAILYRVWAHCNPIEWNCTIKECADAIGEPSARVRNIVTDKGWHRRFRSARSVTIDIYRAAPPVLQSPNDPATFDW